eukprot:TRINITY_DN18597_c0_g1_i3.p1 TRINITY_DN18597_c0_g1~~TRINITY_DN18597_c0_g1_i3.p1  ORF type:complete len:252 (+),score=19.75 TRINITY_DN18597_c0_g1_i3:96-758(+)
MVVCCSLVLCWVSITYLPKFTCNRRLTYLRDRITCLRFRNAPTRVVEIQGSTPVPALVGLQHEHDSTTDFASVGAASRAWETNDHLNVELHSLQSDSSASSLESVDSFLPSRRRAKEALRALFKLSRSARGADGQVIPLHLYSRVAECLGRRHYERYWREERDRMRELTRTLYPVQMEALLQAIERRDEAQDEATSVCSYASSLGSLTRRWKLLLRWFRS